MRHKTPTVWEALNEPVMEITEEQAKHVFLASIVIMAAAWIAPYWGATPASAYHSSLSSEGTIFEQMARVGSGEGMVAGATTGIEVAPEWYYVVAGIPEAVVQSFGAGSNEVLDISQPVSNLAAFYEPGVSEVWNGWLELMADPRQ